MSSKSFALLPYDVSVTNDELVRVLFLLHFRPEKEEKGQWVNYIRKILLSIQLLSLPVKILAKRGLDPGAVYKTQVARFPILICDPCDDRIQFFHQTNFYPLCATEEKPKK